MHCPSCAADVPPLRLIFSGRFQCGACATRLRVVLRPSFLFAALLLGAGSAIVMRPDPLWVRATLAAVIAGLAAAAFSLTLSTIAAESSGSPGRPGSP